ncbi:vitamin K epoxide reductase family protein [Cellulomonas sp. URHD0024]|uniref:vitamin K epoxide reductase family protein n=1 Tax=Cellulomonas sp. URHD0024 TaxID=1302620 RepID=UPI00042416EB|nr:vitamin K epoxide reductase family protein [Cellulomonas sp. URHD0024]
MADATRATSKGVDDGVPDPETDLDPIDDDDLDDYVDPDPDLLEPPTLEWRRRTAIEMVISGALGLLASFVLSIDALKLAHDPKAALSCSINPVLDCAKVALRPEAHILGDYFPNAFLGIAAESVVITIAVAMIGGVVFPRWFMLSAQAVYSVGLLFAWYLFGVSYFAIHALCPWCLLITATTTLVWAGLTRINVRDGVIDIGPGARRFVASGNDWFVTVAVLVFMVAAIVLRYGSQLIA